MQFSKKYLFSFGLVFLFYLLISVVIFFPRWQNIVTHYGAADFDTDGTLWYYWARLFTDGHQINFNFTNELVAFPFGYDVSHIPYFSLIYELNLLGMRALGGGWQSIVLVSNLSTLLSYPLAAFTAFLLTFYLTKKTYPSFISGLIFSYSYYHVLMVRGSLSQNHLEFIPLFYLTFLFFLDKPTWKSLLLSSFTFAVLFLSNAYWAFFSIVFTPIFVLFYGTRSLRQRILLGLAYYPSAIVTSIALNLNYVYYQLYNLSPYQLLYVFPKAGTVKDQLISTLSFFSPSANALFRPWEYLGGDHYLGYTAVLIALIGLFIRRKQKVFALFMAAFLLAILLSSRVSPFLVINETYFQYFRAFRAVSRLVIFAALFLGILVALSLDKIKDLISRNLPKTLRKRAIIVLALCFPLLILVDGTPASTLHPQMTNFQRIANLYQPIKENDDIRRIAAYPMEIDGEDGGFPRNYQLIGQIIHGKTLVGGKDRFITQAKGFESQIKDLNDPQAIDVLDAADIDTILIYHRMYSQSDDDIRRLKADSRIVYLGTFEQPFDENRDRSSNDLSRKYSLFQIRDVVERNHAGVQLNPELTSTLPSENITVQKVSATRYAITLQNVKEPFALNFTEPFTQQWQLFVDGKSEPVFLAEREVFENCCSTWKIDPQRDFPALSSTDSPESTADLHLSLVYTPVRFNVISEYVRWGFLFLIASAVFVYQIVKGMRKKNQV